MIGLSLDDDNKTRKEVNVEGKDEQGNAIKTTVIATVIDPSVLSWRNWTRRLFYFMLIGSIITWLGYVLTPTRKDALLIIAGGATMNYVQNDTLLQQVPKNIFNFVNSELTKMAVENNVEIDFLGAKEKAVENLKSFSAEEIIEKLKIDTTLARLILK